MIKSNKPIIFNSHNNAAIHLQSIQPMSGVTFVPFYCANGSNYAWLIQAINSMGRLTGYLCSDGVIRRIGPSF